MIGRLLRRQGRPERGAVVCDDGQQFYAWAESTATPENIVSRGLTADQASRMAAELQVRRCIGAA